MEPTNWFKLLHRECNAAVGEATTRSVKAKPLVGEAKTRATTVNKRGGIDSVSNARSEGTSSERVRMREQGIVG